MLSLCTTHFPKTKKDTSCDMGHLGMTDLIQSPWTAHRKAPEFVAAVFLHLLILQEKELQGCLKLHGHQEIQNDCLSCHSTAPLLTAIQSGDNGINYVFAATNQTYCNINSSIDWDDSG